jgi:hypothetical protein
MGGFGFFAIRIELEVGFELGYGLILFLHFLGDFGKGEVCGGVVGLNLDGVFGTEVGAGQVVVVHVEHGDLQVFVYALVIGLNVYRLGEFAMDGGPFGTGVSRERSFRVSVRIIAAGAAATTGIVPGKSWRGSSGEWMLFRGRGWSGSTGVGGVRWCGGVGGSSGEWELLSCRGLFGVGRGAGLGRRGRILALPLIGRGTGCGGGILCRRRLGSAGS